jgi:hypothetical protein
MERVLARTVTAEMIDDEILRDRADERLVDQSVGFGEAAGSIGPAAHAHLASVPIFV